MTCHKLGIITYVQLLGAPPFQNFGEHNTSKNRRGLGQLSTLTASISETQRDVKNRNSKRSTTVFLLLNKKMLKFFANKTIFCEQKKLCWPKVNIARDFKQF